LAERVATALSALSIHLQYQPLFLIAKDVVRPSTVEIKTVFNDVDIDLDDTDSEGFQRLDESPDKLFYSEPRFVEHIDSKAVIALARFHNQELRALNKAMYQKDSPLLDVLDLCSSWVSHLPPEFSQPSSLRVVGVGMNEKELQRNAQLTSYVVKDLNVEPKLPFPDDSFDAVLLQLSIDYLTQPIDVLKEAGRVLRPSGEVLISFSNRVFID
jgi:SAM-dependent methyltransferase